MAAAGMEQFLRFVIGKLVEFPDEVVITPTETEDRTIFHVEMRKSDLGKMIGKGGQTIHAIRDLLSACGEKHGRKVTLHIVE